MAGRSARGNRGKAPVTIIVRHDDEDEEASTHSSGAWKVAYADFVTAMMAFFMLMWLLNATTEVQRTGLADYFAPTNLFGRSVSGSGKPFGGQTPNDAGTSVSSDGMPQVIKGHHSPQQDVEAADADTLATPLPESDAATDGASRRRLSPTRYRRPAPLPAIPTTPLPAMPPNPARRRGMVRMQVPRCSPARANRPWSRGATTPPPG